MAHPIHEGDGLAKRLGSDPDDRRHYSIGKSVIIKGIVLYL